MRVGSNWNMADTSGTGISIHNHSEFIGFIGNDSGKMFINAGGTQDFLSLRTNGTEALIIKSNQRVGIGTDKPTAQLDVNKSGTGTVEDTIITRTSGGGAFAVQCSDVAAANPVWALRTYSTEDIVFSPGGHADVNEKVRIKANTGYVGIGTDNPGAKLEAYGADAGIIVHNSSHSRGGIAAFTNQM